MNELNTISHQDIEILAGFKLEDAVIDTEVSSLYYRPLGKGERDDIILQILKKIQANKLISVGENNSSRWEKGWGEILENVKKNGATIETLQPQYFHYNVVRYRGDFIFVERRDFEYQLYTVLREIIFKRYLSEVDCIVDFGCGTGVGVLLLSELFPEKYIVGCDWAKPSQQILEHIAQSTNSNVKGVWFNMLTMEGADHVPYMRNQAFVTTHAMEQLGGKYKDFLDFILSRKPRLCLHIEPIIEFYNEDNLFDLLAIEYHRKRNYLNGYLSALLELEKQKKIEFIEKRRMGLGCQFHEGYSLLVWRPL